MEYLEVRRVEYSETKRVEYLDVKRVVGLQANTPILVTTAPDTDAVVSEGDKMPEIEVRPLPVGRRDPIKAARRCRKCVMIDGQTVEPDWVEEHCTGCSMHTWYLENIGEYV